jgi:hypothetical protein
MNSQLNELIKVVKAWIDEKRIGSITINFFKGGIANLIVKESVKIGDNNK